LLDDGVIYGSKSKSKKKGLKEVGHGASQAGCRQGVLKVTPHTHHVTL
jgi:hypothetical protein